MSAATLLSAQGADQRVVMEILGYSRIGMTNRYARVLPKVMAEGPGVAARPLGVRCEHNATQVGRTGAMRRRNARSERVRRQGLEPRTRGLRVRCSAN